MARGHYFISDPHFGHRQIIQKERRMFSAIKEHDAYIIQEVNKVVKPKDVLYILGDVGDLEKVRYLNGYKILFLGNHDKRPLNEFYGYFSEVHDKPLFLSKRIVLSHFPVPVAPHVLNVHGHLHAAYLDSPNYFNVSIHMIDYKPVSRQEIDEKVRLLPKENVRFLEEWWADMHVFTEKDRTDVIMDDNGKILLNESIKHRRTYCK